MTNITIEPITLERVFRKSNLMEALKSVERNKGSAGVDGMRTDELRLYIKHNPNKLNNMIMDGKYRPQPLSEEGWFTVRKALELLVCRES